MSNKKQSSVDKFVQQLKRKGLLITEDSEYIVAYLEAKAMHKEEIVEAVYDSMGTSFDPSVGRAELYYKEKYENGYK